MDMNLLRDHLLRVWLNKGKKKDRSCRHTGAESDSVELALGDIVWLSGKEEVNVASVYFTLP